MNSNWLSSMLTKAKQKSSMWLTLADTIQASFDDELSIVVDTITRNRSVMTMSVEEVKRKQESLGHFFSVLDAPDVEKGLTLLHRLDQIHLKATEFPIKDMVKRNFDGLEMDWSPVYAPINQEEFPYGTRFIAQTEFDNLDASSKEQYFMTSRGRMILNLNKYLPPKEEMDKIYNTIFETIIPLIPLDIVFDGFFTQVKIVAVFDIHFYTTFTHSITDTFKNNVDVTPVNKLTENLNSHFKLSNDFFSIDSSTRQERQPFQARNTELLGEQPLGTIPLGSSYNSALIIDEGMLSEPLKIGDKWKSSHGLSVPSNANIVLPPSNSFIYHAINCEVGARYAVSVRKENNARTRFIISRSNGAGGEVASVFERSNNRAAYGISFQATGIAMYIVVELDPNIKTICSDINIRKLTAI